MRTDRARTADVPGPPPQQSVLAALDALDCFATSEELGVTEVSRRLGVAKSTAHRLLTALCSRGMVDRMPETGHYRLGLHLWELGQLVQDRGPLRQIALPVLEEVRLRTGQTTHLAIADGSDVVFVEVLPSVSAMRLLGGRQRRVPLHTTSAGKVLAAFNPEVSEARVAAGFPVLTDRTIRTAGQWASCLADVRRHGLAVSDSDNQPGLASVAAPVTDSSGQAVAAVSVAGPSAELLGDLDRHSRVVLAAADRISRRAGG